MSSTASPPPTKNLILDASIGLMQRRGYQAVGMREIAEQVQIKAASLYHHFPSKEVLAKEAMKHYCEVQKARLADLDQRPGIASRLAGYAELFAAMLADGPRLCLYPVLTEAHESLTEPCLEVLAQFAAQNVRWLQKTLDEGFQVHGRPAGSLSARDLAELIFGAFEGYMVVAMIKAQPAKAFRANASQLLKTLLPRMMAE